MTKYRIVKVGQNAENKYAGLSKFGDSKEFFEGYSKCPPVKGERFILHSEPSSGHVVIDTSAIVEEPKDGIMKTLYSVYKIDVVYG